MVKLLSLLIATGCFADLQIESVKESKSFILYSIVRVSSHNFSREVRRCGGVMNPSSYRLVMFLALPILP